MSKRILLVEDEQEIADIVKLHLEDLNLEVTHAADGIRGLTCLLYTSPSPRDQRGSRMPSSA